MRKRQIVVLDITCDDSVQDPSAWDWPELIDADSRDAVTVIAAGAVAMIEDDGDV